MCFYKGILFFKEINEDNNLENDNNKCIDEEKELLNNSGSFKKYETISPLLSQQSSAENKKYNEELDKKMEKAFDNIYFRLSDEDNEN